MLNTSHLRHTLPSMFVLMILWSPQLDAAQLDGNTLASREGEAPDSLVRPSGGSAPIIELEVLAEDGDAESQFLVGGLYARGEGVSQDPVTAAMWWHRSAEQGLAEAQNELGVAFTEGQGVPRDLEQAVQWYRLAAEQGLAVAQANLGTMYWNGTGVGRSERRAIHWYRKAAEQGLAWAQIFLGDAYSAGRGLPLDKKEAMKWYRKAADQDYPEAQLKLGLSARRHPPASIPATGGRPLEAYGEYWIAKAARSGLERAKSYLDTLALQSCKRIVALTTISVRSHPDTSAPIDRVVDANRACVLAEPGWTARRRTSWTAVYLQDRHEIGFVSLEEASEK